MYGAVVAICRGCARARRIHFKKYRDAECSIDDVTEQWEEQKEMSVSLRSLTDSDCSMKNASI